MKAKFFFGLYALPLPACNFCAWTTFFYLGYAIDCSSIQFWLVRNMASITNWRHVPWILLCPQAIHIRCDYHCLTVCFYIKIWLP